MGNALLVNLDVDRGAQIVAILDKAGLKINVALWVVLEEYGDWRLLLASRKFDKRDLGEAFAQLDDALRAADFPMKLKPSIIILPTNDSFIRDLRHYFGKDRGEGSRVGGQRFGERWVEDGYVYRIS